MKSFSITQTQIVAIISALIAEELSRNAKRHIDFLTAAAWDAATTTGAGGLNLTSDEYDQCFHRVETFFGFEGGAQSRGMASSLGEWARIVEEKISNNLVTITFTPAGSISNEARCAHNADQMFIDAAAAANLFHGRRRLLSLVAPHSLLGFALTVLTPNLQRIPTLDVRSITPDALQEALRFGDVLVATPTLWRYILQQKVVAPDNTMGVFFGEPMSLELSADMRQAGFGAQREIYGSTENGLIGWRDSPTEQFVLFDHWRKDGEKLSRLGNGDDTQAVIPMDVLAWSGNRRFTLAGRRDGAVQIGAMNVFPDNIAQILKGHKFVGDCAIRIGKHKGGVNRLIANIKLKDSIAPSEATVRGIDYFCRSNLKPQERPSIFHFVDALDG